MTKVFPYFLILKDFLVTFDPGKTGPPGITTSLITGGSRGTVFLLHLVKNIILYLFFFEVVLPDFLFLFVPCARDFGVTLVSV